MDELIKDSKELYKRLLESVNHPLIATDTKGKIIYWNEAATELYQWEAKEVIGKNIINVTPTNATKKQATNIMKTLQEGKSWKGEFEVKKKDGTTFPAIISDSPIIGDDGNLIGIVGITTDLTKQEKEEEELSEQKDELEEMNKVMVGRELKMIELKRENEELRKECEKLRLETNNH